MPDMFAEVLPHPFAPKTKSGETQLVMLTAMKRDQSAGIIENGDGRAIVPVIFTTASEDRHGSKFDPDGWDFGAFRKNPVVLWSHMQRIPLIANALDLRRDGDSWRSNLDFALTAWDAFAGDRGGNLARLVYTLMKEDRLRAMSHGFIPKKMERYDATTIPSFFAENVRYLNTELTEQSVVNVPSNRESVRSAIGAGIITENEADLLLGFGFSLEAEQVILDRSKPRITKIDAAKLRNQKGAKKSFDTTFVRSLLERCCGPYNDPCCADDDDTETVTQEQQDYEINLASSIVAEYLDLLGIALDGWKNSTHDDLRSMCSSLVWSAMSAIDWIARYMDEWYDYELDLSDAPVSADDLTEFSGTAESTPASSYGLASADFLTRAGAVLSAANLSRVQKMMDNASEITGHGQYLMDAAKKAAPADRATFTLEDLERAASEKVKKSGGTSDGDVQSQPPTVTGAPAASEPVEPNPNRSWLSLLDLKL